MVALWMYTETGFSKPLWNLAIDSDRKIENLHLMEIHERTVSVLFDEFHILPL